MSHPAFTLLLMVLLSVAMAMVENRTRRERVYVAAHMFFSCAATILAGSWLMHLVG